MVMKTQDDKYCATKSSGLMGVEEKNKFHCRRFKE